MIKLVVLVFFIFPKLVFGWGSTGHEITVEGANKIVPPVVFKNCNFVPRQLVEHVNDPDKIWREKRIAFPHETTAHFFHVNRQPKDWRSRKEPYDRTQGFLVYRILSWVEEAKEAKKKSNWEKLHERLYGITHYLGDITQPLHLHPDYDGKDAGLPDLHSQFETQMVNRYEKEIRAAVFRSLSREKIPVLWPSFDLKKIIFDTAEQSFLKVEKLFKLSKPALTFPKVNRRKKTNPFQKPRFVKKILWESTGSLAIDQMALSSRLIAHVLSDICL